MAKAFITPVLLFQSYQSPVTKNVKKSANRKRIDDVSMRLLLSKKFWTGPFEQTPWDPIILSGPRARALKPPKFDTLRARARTQVKFMAGAGSVQKVLLKISWILSFSHWFNQANSTWGKDIFIIKGFVSESQSKKFRTRPRGLFKRLCWKFRRLRGIEINVLELIFAVPSTASLRDHDLPSKMEGIRSFASTFLLQRRYFNKFLTNIQLKKRFHYDYDVPLHMANEPLTHLE